MRKIFAIVVVAILLMVGVTGGLILLRPNANGWNESNLVEPSIGIIDHPSAAIPGPLTGSYRASSWTLSWLLSQVYVSYGGVAWVSLNNTSNGPLFVYQISILWSGTNISSGRPTAALIEPDEKVEIGMLSFPAPPSTGYHEYTIQLGLAAGYPMGVGMIMVTHRSAGATKYWSLITRSQLIARSITTRLNTTIASTG
jgi:hypothetical protein